MHCQEGPCNLFIRRPLRLLGIYVVHTASPHLRNTVTPSRNLQYRPDFATLILNLSFLNRPVCIFRPLGLQWPVYLRRLITRDKRDEQLAVSTGNPVERSSAERTVERLGPSEFDTVAGILALAYNNYPLHIWNMPNAATRIADARVFFKFFLKMMRPDNRDVFVTSDRSAALISSIARKGERLYPKNVRQVLAVVRKTSPLNDYLEWVETFRPNVDQRCIHLFGALPDAPRGTGSFLLANVLKIFDREGLPVWMSPADPLTLPLFRRFGFEIGNQVRRDADTPPVHLIWRPAMPQGEAK